MAGTIVVDRLESDASYASSINIASPVIISNTTTFTNTTTFRSNSTISTTTAESLRLHRSGSSSQISSIVMEDGGSSVGTANTVRLSTSLGALSISTGGTGGSSTGGTEQMSVTSTGLLQFNSGYGSVATAYGCRAWVNFNGTGTVAINGSGNVSSITDDGVGSYFVNLTNAMPDANFSATLSSGTNSSGGLNAYTTVISSTSVIAVYTYSIAGGGAGAYRDTASVLFAVFR